MKYEGTITINFDEEAEVERSFETNSLDEYMTTTQAEFPTATSVVIVIGTRF
jgi:hypothetical protein